MSAYQRRKGAAGEREWVAVLRDRGIPVVGRQLGQARDGGGDVCAAPFLYEVKRYNKIAVRKWLDQAARSVIQFKPCISVPVVAMREDGRSEWMVLLRAEDFFNLTLRGKP
jgi:Holliday junction resolvase